MFDFNYYASMVVSFFSDNIFITIGALVLLIFFIYKKPSETIKFLGFCFLLVAVLYIMSLLTQSGTDGVIYKKGAATKTEKELLDE